MTAHDPFDRPSEGGLQNERTALAWRRTALAIATASLIGLRVISERVGAWALLPAGMGLVIAVVMTLRSRLRYRTNRVVLTSVTQVQILNTDGRFLLSVTALVALTGLVCLLVLVVGGIF